MLACDKRRARETHAEIEEQRVALQECTFLESDTVDDSARFLRVLQVTHYLFSPDMGALSLHTESLQSILLGLD